MKIILATQSPARNKCFSQSNILYEAMPADIDEEQYKNMITEHKYFEGSTTNLLHGLPV